MVLYANMKEAGFKFLRLRHLMTILGLIGIRVAG